MLTLHVNGIERTLMVEPRILLLDVLRDELGLTGAHAGCEHGVCGACTVLADDQPVRSCLMLAIQAEGMAILTVEGLPALEGELHPVQNAFWECHALQCGFCTPAMILATVALLQQNSDPSDSDIRRALAGHICRCTGYVNIVKAVHVAAERL